MTTHCEDHVTGQCPCHQINPFSAPPLIAEIENSIKMARSPNLPTKRLRVAQDEANLGVAYLWVYLKLNLNLNLFL